MPKIFLVCGYIASGKTTTSNALADRIGAEVIRTDDVRKRIFPKRLDHGSLSIKDPEFIAWVESNDSEVDFQQVLNPFLDNEAYAELISKYGSRIGEQRKRVYDEAFFQLGALLLAGKNVLFDATFSSADMRKRVYEIAIKSGVKTVYIIQVVCDEQVVESRLAKRASGSQITSSNAKEMVVFRKVKEEFDGSRIQNDAPELNVARILYNTGTQAIDVFGQEDETTKTIMLVLSAISEKYATNPK